MLDQLPAEICAYIFTFACRDSGYTGRSLSLVSKYIHETSKLARYMSIALIGRGQILAFAQFLDQTPTQLSTRYLFIGGQGSEEEMNEIWELASRAQKEAQVEYRKLAELLPSGDEKLKEAKDAVERERANKKLYLDTFGKEGASAVTTILRTLAPTLEILDISLNDRVARKMLHTISLPHLTDLTTRCGFPLHPTDDPVLEPTHSLRYLHVVETYDQWNWVGQFFERGISHFAPSLTHLRLSQLAGDESVITHLEAALGLSASASGRVNQLPSTVELVLLKPDVAPPPHNGCYCCDDTVEYHNLLTCARQLRDKEDHRVVLLQADSARPAEDVYFQEWMDKFKCSWDTSNKDMESAG
ncbi:hypothetical protein B0H14DRAFT_3420913 [Mycena olivaceomarginata]|nr:hypothetical protein B0H14DRAFT_3420913 [Mycena olivaceomarginata]